MAAEIFKALSNLRIVLDTETDADSPDNETTYAAIRTMIEMLYKLGLSTGITGTLTSNPPNDATGVATDSAKSWSDDQHNGRTLLFTSGAAKGNIYTIDDTTTTTIVCSGDNLYAAGARSGDDYEILYDLKVNTDGHNHDGINSASATVADAAIVEAKIASDAVVTTKIKTGAVTDTTVSGNLQSASVDISLQDYCFFPNIYSNNVVELCSYMAASGAVSTARFRLRELNNDVAGYVVRYRYVTSSDQPFLFALQNKTTGKIDHLWIADDPPPGHWGKTVFPVDDHTQWPVIPSDPGNYIPIALFGQSREFLNSINQQAFADKKYPYQVLCESFEYDTEKKLFKSKNIKEI